MTATLQASDLAAINTALGVHPDTPLAQSVLLIGALWREAHTAQLVRSAATDLVESVRLRRRAGWERTPFKDVDRLERVLDGTRVTAPLTAEEAS